jgi:hypothetical protein
VVDTIPWVFVTKLETIFPTLDLSRIAYEAISPSIFWNSTSATLGLAYLNYTESLGGNNYMYLCKSAWNITVVGGRPPNFRVYVYPDWETPLQNSGVIGSQFAAYSLDTVYVNNSTLAVVFAGMNYSVPRDPDVWFMTTNATDPSGWTLPRCISLSSDVEDSPSIAVLKGNVLAVVYRRNVLIGPDLIQWQVYITASANGGWTWTRPQQLPASSIESYAPWISALRDGGFMYTFHSSTSQTLPASPAIFFGQNPLEGWWLYTVGSVQCLATGDTDGDQRSEIIAGSLGEIYKLEPTDIGNSTQYLQTWTSPPLPQMVTSIAIGDINGDGVSEIVATAAGGNVYAYKWTVKG